MNATRSSVQQRIVLMAALCALALPMATFAALKYQPGDYVQEGLVMHLDGIANVGAGLPHNPSANMWANLADMSNPARIVGNNSSGWRNGYGYYFCWDSWCSYAQLAYATPAMTQATFEFAFEGSWAEQTAKNWGPCFVAGANNHNISLGTAASPLYFRSVNWTGTSGAATGQEISNWSWKQASFTFGAAGAGGYDVGDYVQGGLAGWLDGIRNAGANLRHDSLACGAAIVSVAAPLRLVVESDIAEGPVKPVNGVGQPPMIGALDKWSAYSSGMRPVSGRRVAH